MVVGEMDIGFVRVGRSVLVACGVVANQNGENSNVGASIVRRQAARKLSYTTVVVGIIGLSCFLCNGCFIFSDGSETNVVFRFLNFYLNERKNNCEYFIIRRFGFYWWARGGIVA